MKFPSTLAGALCVLLLAAPPSLHAQDDDSAKLRDTLRNALLQTRDLQNKVATLEAKDADNAITIADLEKKLAAAQKQLAEDKSMADRAIALLQDKNAEQEAEIGRLRVALEKWKASHKEAAALAQKTEIQRAKLAKEKIELERIVTDQRAKNNEMYKAGLEILDRYKNHSFGDAILAREPFSGTMRAKLQSLSQDLGDKLADARIKTDAAKPNASAAAPAAPQTQAKAN